MKPIDNFKCNVSFDRFIQDNGWCSFAFLELSKVLIDILSKRGIDFKFSIIGPVLSRGGERLLIATTGYTPPAKFNLPLSDASVNYLHLLDQDGNPFLQVHRTQQEKLVDFVKEYFSLELEREPLTQDELEMLTAAVNHGNRG